MAKDIEVVVTGDIKTLGTIGTRKRVKRGYARNFLIPNGLAMLINADNLKKLEAIEKAEAKKQVKLKAEAKVLQKKINNTVISFEQKAKENNKLYGSVTPNQVISKLNKEFKLSLDKTALKMPGVIKELGEYELSLALHEGIDVKIKVDIKPEKDVESKKEK